MKTKNPTLYYGIYPIVSVTDVGTDEVCVTYTRTIPVMEGLKEVGQKTGEFSETLKKCLFEDIVSKEENPQGFVQIPRTHNKLHQLILETGINKQQFDAIAQNVNAYFNSITMDASYMKLGGRSIDTIPTYQLEAVRNEFLAKFQ